MKIEGLGKLVTDESIEEWLISEPVEIPLFPGHVIRFIFDGISGDNTPEDYVDAFRNFMHLSLDERQHAEPYIFQNYLAVVRYLEPEDIHVDIDSPKDVWNHVEPTEVFVIRRMDDMKVYIQINAECGWEEEHGLQIVYREGKTLSRVSEQDGHLTHSDAWGLPESEDRIC